MIYLFAIIRLMYSSPLQQTKSQESEDYDWAFAHHYISSI